eukprot:TRINITY_DN5236_c0_g1_i1.p1 TRINITY_DN5236_c0_g1~~TRINITY_DN5236_c0_g1_i1.p1  ORF type:complete len:230 (+),score=42.70 TRINITY_DN5236_c0_g1_i1:1081-1770(+)
MELDEKSAESDRTYCKLMKSKLPESTYAMDPNSRTGVWKQRRPSRPIDRNRSAEISSDDTESDLSDTLSDIEFYESADRIMNNRKSTPTDWLPPEEADPFRYSDTPFVMKGFAGKGKARVGRLNRVIFDLAVVEESEDGSTDADDEMEDEIPSSLQRGHPRKKQKFLDSVMEDTNSIPSVPDLNSSSSSNLGSNTSMNGGMSRGMGSGLNTPMASSMTSPMNGMNGMGA